MVRKQAMALETSGVGPKPKQPLHFHESDPTTIGSGKMTDTTKGALDPVTVEALLKQVNQIASENTRAQREFTNVSNKIITCAVAEIRALIGQPAPASNVEPVAWRYKHSSHRDWSYSIGKPEGPSIHLFTVEPLYASPPSVRPVERERLIAAMIGHFKATIEASAGCSFEETNVHLPTKSFEGYADAIISAEQPVATGTSASKAMSSTERDDFILVPRELTAENGAKAALIGEFTESFEYCDQDGDEQTAHIPVSWTTIKEIYKAAVKHFGTVSQTDKVKP
jgi:hypothetical protein